MVSTVVYTKTLIFMYYSLNIKDLLWAYKALPKLVYVGYITLQLFRGEVLLFGKESASVRICVHIFFFFFLRNLVSENKKIFPSDDLTLIKFHR